MMVTRDPCAERLRDTCSSAARAALGLLGSTIKVDPAGRYIVVYRDDTDARAANARAKGLGIGLDRTYKAALKGYAARLNPGQLAKVKADPAVAYVAAVGDLWNDSPERGLFKTTDGGQSWKPVLHSRSSPA